MDINWDRVADGLRGGSYNLLLGAGVSLDSNSASRNPLLKGPLPTVGKLREDLSVLLPNIRPGSSLNRLYRNLSPEEVNEQITERFSRCVPGDTVKKITEFRWRRIFTLNVDDALEEAYRCAAYPAQKPHSINYVDHYMDYQNKEIVPIIHLHGFARKPSDGYVFDIKEYMKSISDNSLWAHILGHLIRSEPFFVLGTSLEEPDITYFLADREAVAVRTDRPPSIIAELYPDQGTNKDCEEYSLALHHGSALDFLRLADNKVPNRPTVMDIVRDNLGDLVDTVVDQSMLAIFYADFERVPITHIARGTHSSGGPNFALGHAATWADIQDDYDASRMETDALRKSISSAVAGDLCLLLGDPGAGKSTILKRMALELARSGTVCLWRRSVGRVRVNEAVAVLRSIGRPIVVFADNFADYAIEINSMRKALDGLEITFVGAERYYRFDHIKRLLGRERIKLSRVGRTGEAVALNLIKSYRALGLSTTDKSRDAYFAAEIAADPIAVACCRIINSYEPLDRIIDRSFSDASTNARRCYLIVALSAHCLRDGIQYDIVSSLLKGYSVESQMDEAGPLPIGFRDAGDIELVVPLNEAVSASILRRSNIKVPDDVFWTFKAIASGIRPYVNIGAIRAGDPNSRLASRLFDYDEVVKELLGHERAAEFYDVTRAEWSWNSRYWHQIALMRLDAASMASDVSKKSALCDQAVQHARHAKTIEERHQFTLTTLGKVLFGKMEVLGRTSAADLEEAIGALSESVRIERRRNRMTVHPFMVLFSGVNSASELGAIYSFDQRSVITRLAREAKDSFPTDRDLNAEADKMLKLLR